LRLVYIESEKKTAFGAGGLFFLSTIGVTKLIFPFFSQGIGGLIGLVVLVLGPCETLSAQILSRADVRHPVAIIVAHSGNF